MTTVEQRLGQLEGTHQHLATKSDLAELEAKLTRDIGNLKGEIGNLETRLIKWMVGQMIAAIVAASSIALVVQRFLD